ncbi:MAG TPA: cadherin-like domain-containing protein [Actinomycetota bacterium]|nr:cadherin-like domain-containing protein [Actinomycetota bacterium]
MTLLAAIAVTMTFSTRSRAEAATGEYAATAEVDRHVQFVGDSDGEDFTFTVNNTGTTEPIAAVSFRRPSNRWTVTGCPQGPTGWDLIQSDVRCAWKSQATAADDIAPGASLSDFVIHATTEPSAAQRSSNWTVTVSRINRFSAETNLQATPTGPDALRTTAYVWEVTDAIVATSAATPDTACPSPAKAADAGTSATLVICGRNHGTANKTPSQAKSSLAGSFVGAASSFSSSEVAADSASDVVLGNWDFTVTATVGTGKTVETVLGAGPTFYSKSPLTVLEGYEAIQPLQAPDAVDDSFDAAGNLHVDVDAASGLLANDFTDTATVSSVDDSLTDGDVSVDPDGSFTFDPDAGFDGSTTFDYTLTNAAGSDTATVTISVSEPNVWFIDNEASAGGDGTHNEPFDALADFNAIQGGGGALHPEAGDIVFVHDGSGAYDGGITLANGQHLIGQGHALTYPTPLPDGSPSLPGATTHPTLSHSSGDAITLGNNNTIKGLEIAGTSGAKIKGTTFGTATITNTSTSGAGAILDVDSGTLDATFSSLGSSSSSGAAIDASNVAGTMSVTGATTITGAAGDGIKITGSPTASFDFGEVDVTTTAGKGIVATNAGTLNAGNASSDVSATGGPALDLDGTALDVDFNSLSSSTSSGDGVKANNVTGTLDVAGTTAVSGATGDGVELTGSNTADFVFSKLNVAAAGRGLVATNAGDVTVSDSTSSISSSGAAVLDLNGVNFVNTDLGTLSSSSSTGGALKATAVTGTMAASGTTTITNAAGDGIALTSNPTGTFNFGKINVTTTAGRGLVATNSGTVNVSNNTSTISATGGAAIHANPTTLGVTLASLSSTNSTGSGLSLNGVSGSLAVTGATTISGADGVGIDVDGGTANVDLSSASTVTISSRDGQAIDLDGGSGTRSLGNTSVSNPNSVAGDAVVVRNRSASTTFGQLNGGGAGDSQLYLENNTAAVSVNGGTITSGAGPELDVSGGNANVNMGAAISNSAGRSVRIVNHTGGTATLSGAITDTGTGILADNNDGSVVDFTGGMNVSSGANTAFAAINGGTVKTSGVNVLASTTQPALNVADTTIGTGGLNFRSVSSNGASSGIVVSNTGSTAGLNVTGIGTTAGTGGTIASSTTDGVKLTNTRDAVLTNMSISSSTDNAIDMSGATNVDVVRTTVQGSGNHGIHASGSNGLDLLSSTIQNNGNANDENGVNLVNHGGTSLIDATTLDNSPENLVMIRNLNTNATINVRNGSMFKNTGGTFGGDGILAFANGTSGINLDVENSTFRDLKDNSVQILPETAGSNGVSSVRFVNNLVHEVTSSSKGGSVVIGGGEAATTNVTITGNTFQNVSGYGLVNTDSNGDSTIRGTISNNTISGADGAGLVSLADDDSVSRIVMSGNNLSNVGGDGIQVVNFGGVLAGDTTELDAVLTNNTITNHSLSTTGEAFIGGIGVFSFKDDTCLALTGNDVNGTVYANGFEDIYLQRDAGTFRFEEVPNTAATGNVNSAYVVAQNPLTPTATIIGSVPLSDGVACDRPS